jgi:hypothetical protein
MNNNYIYSLSAKHFSTYIGKIINYINCDDNILYNKQINFNLHKDKNIIFIGMYDCTNWKNNNYNIIIEKFNNILIMFVGNDIIEIEKFNTTQRIELVIFLNKYNVKIITENEINSQRLTNLLFNNIILPLPIKDESILTDCISFNKDNLHIGVYMPVHRLEFYNYDLITDIAKERPNYKFYMYCLGGCNITTSIKKNYSNICYFIEDTDVKKIYSLINCSLRVVNNDGESMTCVETMILGKHCIYNFPMKHAIYIGNNYMNYKKNILIELDNLFLNLKENYLAKEYYINRNSHKTFIKSINELIK